MNEDITQALHVRAIKTPWYLKHLISSHGITPCGKQYHKQQSKLNSRIIASYPSEVPDNNYERTERSRYPGGTLGRIQVASRIHNLVDSEKTIWRKEEGRGVRK